jgi:hypothetical protein
VKEAAAYYISKIASMKVTFHENIDERDVEIEQMREQLRK